MKIPRLVKYGALGLGVLGGAELARRRHKLARRRHKQQKHEEIVAVPAISSQPHPLIKHLKGQTYRTGYTVKVGKDGRGRGGIVSNLKIQHVDPAGRVRFTNGHLLYEDIHQQDLKRMALAQIEGKRYLKAKNTSAAALKRYKKKNLDLQEKYLAVVEKKLRSNAFKDKDQRLLADDTQSRLRIYSARGKAWDKSENGALSHIQAALARAAMDIWGQTGEQVTTPRSIDPWAWYKAGKAV